MKMNKLSRQQLLLALIVVVLLCFASYASAPSPREEQLRRKAARRQFVLGIAGAIVSLLFFASPAPNFVGLIMAGGVGNHKSGPLICGLCNCVIGLFYCLPFMTGKHEHGWILIAVYAAWALVESVYIGIFFYLSPGKGKLWVGAVTLGSLVAIGASVPLLLLASLETRKNIIGTALALSSFATYVYPWLYIVITTVSVESLFPMQIVTGLLSSLIWLVYACVGVPINWYFLVSNGAGTLSGIGLAYLYCVYYLKEQAEQRRTAGQ